MLLTVNVWVKEVPQLTATEGGVNDKATLSVILIEDITISVIAVVDPFEPTILK